MIRRLQRLIAEGEGQQQDFKYKVDNAVKLARTVSAFANTDGGRLLIGVGDDGSIHGVRSEEEMFVMREAAERYCVPRQEVSFQTVVMPTHGRGRTVLLCDVERAAVRPVCAVEGDGVRPTAYVRVADENIVASPVHLAVWRQESRLRGEAFGDTSGERALLRVLSAGSEGLTLGSLTRLAGVARRQAIVYLARFVRFGLVEIKAVGRQWVFAPAQCMA